ncbi:MAG: DUF4249 domain-containing protein [Bacteroidota bacterium]
MSLQKISPLLAIIALLAFGCIENIDLPNDDPRLVIEALITNQGASILLTSSVSKTASNEFPTVNDALLLLENEDGEEIPLVNVEDGRYASPQAAEVGKRYKLQVTRAGTTYTAFSTMPDSILSIDSLQHRYEEIPGENTEVSVLTLFLQDPPGEENRGIIRVRGNNGFFQEGLYDDAEVDGQYRIEDFQLDQALPIGTVLTVELLQLELNVFRYFEAIEEARNDGAVGGLTTAPPVNPQGNFDKDALGLFAAATSTSIIIEVN